MELLIAFALKSFLIAGVTLGLLHLLRHRSSAERSMVAHFGLLALLLLPIGSMLLPQVVVQAELGSSSPAPTAAPASTATPTAVDASAPVAAADAFDLASLWPAFYGLPAALLLGITLLAVLRLLALRAKASVLVEPSWLSALAHAQRRMDFKHGTALLTSSELRSPISWGVLRPVILLNEEALEARHEAEAIIAHELAHVRGLDWAKLLLARIVSAIFWFNPLVWILAREAHQLREETADDAVLAANVAGTDYAELLIGVARHDCKGLLLGAHGVAPGKGSLSRRVRRVLDASLPRTPVARGFAAGIALGVVGTAAPLAALTLKSSDTPRSEGRYYVSAPEPAESLPSVVAQSVAGATALTGQVVAAQVASAITGQPTPSPALAEEIRAKIAYAEPDEHKHKHKHKHKDKAEEERDSAIERAIAARALGITPDYVAQIRAAAGGIAIDEDDIPGLKAVGVTPQWLREMVRAGYRPSDIDDFTGARAVGVTGAYVADLASAGYRNLPLDDLTAMRALGVTGAYIRGLRAQGITGLTPDKLVELRAHGISAESLRSGLRARVTRPGRPPPAPPAPPELPDDEPAVAADESE